MFIKQNQILLKAMAGLAIGLVAAVSAHGQATPAPSAATAPAAAAPAAPADPTPAPAPLTTPAVTGPLQWLPPAMFDAGPLGKIAANGIVTGFGMVQSNHVPGDNDGQATLSNGQIFIQKADGKFQYFIQAGAYTLPSLGTAFLARRQDGKQLLRACTGRLR